MGLPLAAPQYGADYGLENLHNKLDSRLCSIKYALFNYQTAKKKRDMRLTRIQLASFLLMPMRSLELVSRTRNPYLIYCCFIAPEVFSYYFVRAEVMYYPSLHDEFFEVERRICLRHNNGTCMVTGQENPEVCHIVPPLMSSTPGDLCVVNHLAHYFYAMLGYDGKAVGRNFGSEVGCSNWQWNMLPLDPELHSLWRRARFGFKFIGYTPGTNRHPKTVRLQFHWLQTNWLHPKGTASATMAEVEEMTGIRPTTNAKAIESSLRRRIKSGQVFEVNVDSSIAPKMKLAIDIQWVMVRIAALSGAAAYPNYLLPPSDVQSDYHASISVLMQAETYARSREITDYVVGNAGEDAHETWEEGWEVDEDMQDEGYFEYEPLSLSEPYNEYDEYLRHGEDENGEASANGSDSTGSPANTSRQAGRRASRPVRGEQAPNFRFDFPRRGF